MRRPSAHGLRREALLGCALLLVACGVGDGSDIGPKLPKLPDASCKFVVLDDEGRGVVGATVRVGQTAQGLSGRNGRGDLLAEPRGRVLVQVDARHGAAVAGDTLGAYQVAMTVERDLPQVLHVPDLPAAAAVTLPTGTQPAEVAIASLLGSRLTIPAGCTVGTPEAGTTVTVGLGDLRAAHLPGDLPAPPTGALLFGRGLWVEPAGATFAPGASLDLSDDLGLGAGQAVLYHLDQTTGEWVEVAGGGTAAAGRITAAGSVTTGGLYAFAAPVAATTVSGRVVDSADDPLPDVLVIVDQWKTFSDANGRFVVDRVPATLADGTPRLCANEMFAGATFLPERVTRNLPVTTAPTDFGDLELDTLFAGNVRVQQVLRGRAESVRPARISTLRGEIALVASSDDNGQLLFEDVAAEYFGFQDGRAIDNREVVYGQGIGFLDRGRRWQDEYQFFERRDWYEEGRQSAAYVSDIIGGGPVENAAIVQGAEPGENFVDYTREAGAVSVTRDFSGRATASVRTQRGGITIVSAYSIVNPDGEHLELPLRRTLRVPLGAFVRHGLVAGELTGADPLRQHELRVTRRQWPQEWWDEVVEDRPSLTVLPIDVDPAVTHDDFVAGVPVAGGNLAAAESESPGGVKTLRRVGLAADVLPTEGARIDRDLPLTAEATATFVLPGVLATAEPEFDVDQLALALALQQPSGRIVDVVRDLRGNHAAVGDDLQFTLPPLTGELAGHGWLALLDGSYPSNGSTVRCSALISLPRGSGLPSYPRGNVAFGAFPDVSEPANGATVSADGFLVRLSLPANALHGFLELRSAAPGDLRSWQVLIPRETTEFRFVRLPTEAPTPLIANRQWTLTVSAYFGDGEVSTSAEPYQDLATFAQSIGAVERGASVVTRRILQISTN